MTAAALVDLLQLFEGAEIEVWLEGGWGVDALLGRQTRPHKDLDIIIADDAGHEIDVHAIDFDRDGNGVYRMPNGHDWLFPAPGFAGRPSVSW